MTHRETVTALPFESNWREGNRCSRIQERCVTSALGESAPCHEMLPRNGNFWLWRGFKIFSLMLRAQWNLIRQQSSLSGLLIAPSYRYTMEPISACVCSCTSWEAWAPHGPQLEHHNLSRRQHRETPPSMSPGQAGQEKG